mgnify:FL=1
MAVSVENLSKTYDDGHQVLKNVSFTVADGELACLLGPSGCGKSTMLNIIAGLLTPTDGDVTVDGKSVVGLPPKDRNVGMVFQDYALYPHMTALENVVFPLRVGSHKTAKAEAEKIARVYMDMTGIGELADKKPQDMSGGQQQRVSIARALVQRPKVLLLDEPLSNLDARLRLRIREEIRRLVKETGITTIFVTHDQEEAMSISDRIVLMNEGVVQQESTPQDLYCDPANLFVARFLGNPAINIYDMVFDGARRQFVDGPLRISLDALNAARFRDGGEIADGAKYRIGIRPECLLATSNDIADVTPGEMPAASSADGLHHDSSFTVMIESVEMIGRYSVLHFNVGGTRSRSVVDTRMHIQSGRQLTFTVDYDGVFLFDEHGRRIR